MRHFVFSLLLISFYGILLAQQGDTSESRRDLFTPDLPPDIIFYAGIHEFNDPILIFPCERIFKKFACTIITERSMLDSVPNSRKGWQKLLMSQSCYYIPPRLHQYRFLMWYLKESFNIHLTLPSRQDYYDIFSSDTLHQLKLVNYRAMLCKRYYVIYMSVNTFIARMGIVESYGSKSGYNYTQQNQMLFNNETLRDGWFIKVLLPVIE